MKRVRQIRPRNDERVRPVDALHHAMALTADMMPPLALAQYSTTGDTLALPTCIAGNLAATPYSILCIVHCLLYDSHFGKGRELLDACGNRPREEVAREVSAKWETVKVTMLSYS